MVVPILVVLSYTDLGTYTLTLQHRWMGDPLSILDHEDGLDFSSGSSFIMFNVLRCVLPSFFVFIIYLSGDMHTKGMFTLVTTSF